MAFSTPPMAWPGLPEARCSVCFTKGPCRRSPPSLYCCKAPGWPFFGGSHGPCRNGQRSGRFDEGTPPMLYLWIMLGSALGGAARYWFSGFVANRIGETFPWGTMLVNISGSFVIGFFATLTGPDGRLLVGTTARQFVMIGLCG